MSKKFRGARYSDCGLEVGRWETAAGWTGPLDSTDFLSLRAGCSWGRVRAGFCEAQGPDQGPHLPESKAEAAEEWAPAVRRGEETGSVEKVGRAEQGPALQPAGQTPAEQAAGRDKAVSSTQGVPVSALG